MSDETTPVTERSDEPNDDDLKELLAKRQRAKPNKLTWVLLVLLVLALGFTMGSCMQKAANGLGRSVPGQPAIAPEQPAIASDPAGAIGGRPGGRAGDLTVGTVESVDGSTLTIRTLDGQNVTVEVPEGTPVTSSVDISLPDLQEGSNVVIRGTEGDDGTVTADSVTEGAGALPGGGLRPAP